MSEPTNGAGMAKRIENVESTLSYNQRELYPKILAASEATTRVERDLIEHRNKFEAAVTRIHARHDKLLWLLLTTALAAMTSLAKQLFMT